MKNKQTKQIFYYMLLLGVIIAPCFMYVPPIYGCTVDSITLYTGSSSTSLTASALRIPQGSNAYYYARCTVTNPNQYRILWEFDIDGNGVYEYSTITYYDSSGYYLKAPSGTASRYFSNSGTFNARVRCCLIDASGSAVSSYVSDTCDIYVVGVGSVSAGGETSTPGDDPNTLYIAKGETVDVTAVPTPAVSWPKDISGKDTPAWYIDDVYQDELDGDSTIAVAINTVGTKQVKAKCGTSSLSINIAVVEVDLDMAGVDELDEESIGAFLAKNHNDSDNDGLIDIEDTNISDSDPDLKEVTLTMNPALTVGTLKLTPDNGSIIRIYEYQDKSGGEVYSWDCSSTTFPKTVYIEGYDSTDASPIDLTLTYEYDNVGICSDIVKVTVAQLDIISVPSYLFAQAKYATPIKFEVKGMDNLWITNITGKFYYDQDGNKIINTSESSESVDLTLGTRFVAGDVSGTWTRTNGTGSIYTTIAPASDFSTIDLGYPGTDPIHSTDLGYFYIEVTCQEFLGTTPPSIGVSPNYEDLGPLVKLCSKGVPVAFNNSVVVFSDKDVFACEPGIRIVPGGPFYEGTGKYLNVPITSSTFEPIQFIGEHKNTHLSDSYFFPSSCTAAYPHTSKATASEGCCGVHSAGGSTTIWDIYDFNNFAKYHDASEKIIAHLELTDATLSAQDFKHKLRNYGTRRGGYFYASYGGKALIADPPVLDSGEFVMDLNETSGDFYWNMFPGGKAHIEVESSVTSISGIAGGISAASTIGWAIAGGCGPIGIPFAVGFGVVSGISGLAAAIDGIEGTVEERSAMGAISVNFAVDSQGGNDFYQPLSIIYRDSAGSTNFPLPAVKEAFWEVGHQYTLTVNMDANLSNKTSFLGSTVKVYMEYYEEPEATDTDGDGILDAGDLNSMNEIIMYP